MKYPELLSLRRCSHLSVSPGGGRCAFLVHTPSEAENSYVGRVYVSAFTGEISSSRNTPTPQPMKAPTMGIRAVTAMRQLTKRA